MLILKHVKEHLGGIGACSVQDTISRANDDGIPQRSEVHPVLSEVICAKLLVEYFCYPIKCFWLQHRINWSHRLLEFLTPKHRDGSGHEHSAPMLSGNIQSILGTCAVDFVCKVWVLFGHGRNNAT